MVKHYSFTLLPQSRGYHIITDQILASIQEMPINGIMNVFIHHTSAALTINEAADPDVRLDFESIFNKLVPENLPFLQHTMEGPDDMPAHIKAALIGSSISVPIVEGALQLGTWQGIYLCEFRNRMHSRKVTVSIYS